MVGHTYALFTLGCTHACAPATRDCGRTAGRPGSRTRVARRSPGPNAVEPLALSGVGHCEKDRRHVAGETTAEV